MVCRNRHHCRVAITGLNTDCICRENTVGELLGWNFWRVGLQGTVIIVYILAIYPALTKIGDNAIISIIPRLDITREEFQKLEFRYRRPNRKMEWLSLSAGVLFNVILSQPWGSTLDSTSIFLFISEIIMFGLLGLLIYYGFHNSRYLTMINKRVKLDVFSVDALSPVARWSLSISLAFIGGIIISIVFDYR